MSFEEQLSRIRQMRLEMSDASQSAIDQHAQQIANSVGMLSQLALNKLVNKEGFTS